MEMIRKYFPDFRRVLNECQRYSSSGKIDSAILATFSDVSVSELINNLKEKNFKEVRKWVVSNLDNESSVLFRRIYDSLYECLIPSTIPSAILILAKYQYQSSFCCDQEIN
ncbi:MAG: DNA polymerase, partial [bacterium]